MSVIIYYIYLVPLCALVNAYSHVELRANRVHTHAYAHTHSCCCIGVTGLHSKARVASAANFVWSSAGIGVAYSLLWG